MKNIRIQILLLSLCLMISSTLSAQLINSEKSKEEASVHSRNLEKGVLIVQIATQNKKVAQLEKMIRRDPENKRYKKMLNKTIIDSDALLDATIKAYKKHFHFSEVLFMPDTVATRLYDGERKGIFLDGIGRIDNEIKLETERFYITYVGRPSNSNTGKKSLVVVDGKGKRLGAPFPYAIPFYSFKKLIIGASDAQAIEDAVIRQNRKLKEFRQRVGMTRQGGQA